ncbi:hypothetical protein A6770_03175 [Nostoc minutum NIES-26]|uniref:Uncharacterized protein n=1 Tax=Nostoc minutum NIES-26 TaxID=1844469 RepID=A0A367QKE5_9NOSO|nr:hypothetical protein A6770_03175 [Nostoc minutum NIES-26]
MKMRETRKMGEEAFNIVFFSFVPLPLLPLLPLPPPALFSPTPAGCRQHAQKPSILERSLLMMRRELLLSHLI